MKRKRRRVLQLLIAGTVVALVFTHFTVRSASKPTRAVDMPLSELISNANQAIESFWQWTAAATRRPPISSPRLVSSSSGAKTPCGIVNDISYCGADNSIYYDYQFLNDLYTNIGDYAVVTVLAHEWGHSVQAQLVQQRLPSIAIENQADCFAGTFTRYAERQGRLERGDWREAMDVLYKSGDANEVLPNTDGSHGDGVTRVDAFRFGYERDVPACFCECITESLKKYYGITH
jgi:uncharacterized protein